MQGINDGSCPAVVNGKIVMEYSLWKNMLRRCYSVKTQVKQPTYVGCTVSENFKDYSFFYKWVQQQIGFNLAGYQLDKNLLIKGYRIYFEDTCVFVPKTLNTLLLNRLRYRGDCPLGVVLHQGGNRYLARLSALGKNSRLGCFKTPKEAFQVYKTAKEAHIKRMAELYKDRVDIRVYEALMAYTVEITD
jgi:hypothetical protein